MFCPSRVSLYFADMARIEQYLLSLSGECQVCSELIKSGVFATIRGYRGGAGAPLSLLGAVSTSRRRWAAESAGDAPIHRRAVLYSRVCGVIVSAGFELVRVLGHDAHGNG